MNIDQANAWKAAMAAEEKQRVERVAAWQEEEQRQLETGDKNHQPISRGQHGSQVAWSTLWPRAVFAVGKELNFLFVWVHPRWPIARAKTAKRSFVKQLLFGAIDAGKSDFASGIRSVSGNQF
jgi:hypothetical protein